MSNLAIGPDGLARCAWALSSPDYLAAYHDQEWGRPLRGDDLLFERMSLEAFQSGLSWLIILRKRPAFRKAFKNFSIPRVAAFSAKDVDRLLADEGIVRNRSKIEATVANARATLALDVPLTDLLWSFAPPKRPRGNEIPSTTPESVAMAKALRKRGFRFVGPTTAYALMQATGMVDDHVEGCFVP
jgi:DNA-3-methyladenine glycosylase I